MVAGREEEARKKWVKRQALQHTYGQNDDDIDEEAVDPALVEATREATKETQENNGDVVHISGELSLWFKAT